MSGLLYVLTHSERVGCPRKRALTRYHDIVRRSYLFGRISIRLRKLSQGSNWLSQSNYNFEAAMNMIISNIAQASS